MTFDRLVASGLASIPSSCTWSPALPSRSLAATMLAVVSGQMVVHSESVKARITTLPRKALSDTGCPNWLVSRKSGAAPLIEVPVSRFGLSAAACAWAAGLICPPLPWAPLPWEPPLPAPPQAARPSTATAAPAAISRARAAPMPTPTPCRSLTISILPRAPPARRAAGVKGRRRARTAETPESRLRNPAE